MLLRIDEVLRFLLDSVHYNWLNCLSWWNLDCSVPRTHWNVVMRTVSQVRSLIPSVWRFFTKKRWLTWKCALHSWRPVYSKIVSYSIRSWPHPQSPEPSIKNTVVSHKSFALFPFVGILSLMWGERRFRREAANFSKNVSQWIQPFSRKTCEKCLYLHQPAD